MRAAQRLRLLVGERLLRGVGGQAECARRALRLVGRYRSMVADLLRADLGDRDRLAVLTQAAVGSAPPRRRRRATPTRRPRRPHGRRRLFFERRRGGRRQPGPAASVAARRSAAGARRWVRERPWASSRSMRPRALSAILRRPVGDEPLRSGSPSPGRGAPRRRPPAARRGAAGSARRRGSALRRPRPARGRPRGERGRRRRGSGPPP